MFKRFLAFLIWFGWMGLIFYFSGPRWSGDRTAQLLETILRFVAPSLLDQLTPTQLQVANWMMRKIAHLLTYALLALLGYHAWRTGAGLPHARALALAFVCAIGYALLDELHQARIPTRTALASDVFIDALGALLACWLIRRGRSRRGATL